MMSAVQASLVDRTPLAASRTGFAVAGALRYAGRRMAMQRSRAIRVMAENVTPAYAGRMLKLAYLAPAVLEALLVRRLPPTVSVKELAAAAELPWPEQKMLIFGPCNP
jgi:hypothetical protein